MMSYVGRCKGCHNLVACVVDMPGHEKQTAKDVADFIRDGLEIGRESVEVVRANFNSCSCNKTQEEKQIGLFE